MPCDYSKYPKNWKAIRAEVLERAGHKCEACDVKNYGIYFDSVDGRREHDGIHFIDQLVTECNYKCVKVVLTISHTDHDITNNGEPGNRPNLKALCQRCHLRHDHHHHQANARQTRTKRKGMAELFTNH